MRIARILTNRAAKARGQPLQRLDVVRVRANPLLPAGTKVGGAVYDVHTGLLRPIQV